MGVAGRTTSLYLIDLAYDVNSSRGMPPRFEEYFGKVSVWQNRTSVDWSVDMTSSDDDSGQRLFGQPLMKVTFEISHQLE